jgi:hypothetical protein
MVNIPTWGKKFRANPEGTPGLPPLGHNIDRCIICNGSAIDEFNDKLNSSELNSTYKTGLRNVIGGIFTTNYFTQKLVYYY